MSALRDAVDQLAASFNRGGLDIPAGLLTPQTAFTLNGRAYEEILGGSADDPLIRLLARGAAGYRTAAKALQYALRGATVAIKAMSEPDADGTCAASLALVGRLRGQDETFESHADLQFTVAGASLVRVDAIVLPEDLAAIAAARRLA